MLLPVSGPSPGETPAWRGALIWLGKALGGAWGPGPVGVKGGGPGQLQASGGGCTCFLYELPWAGPRGPRSD